MSTRSITVAPVLNMPLWQDFLGRMFGREFDLSNLYIPQKPDYPCRAVVVVPELTANHVFDSATRAFNGKTWRYIRNLDTVLDVVERPDGPYVVWFRDTVEADPEMAKKSANDIAAADTNTTTLKERIMLELVYFDETGGHLDLANSRTLCAGSRYANGNVPDCDWDGDRFYVDATGVDAAFSGLRARVAVS